MHCVRKKRWQFIFGHKVAKLIFKILSLLKRAWNFQQKMYKNFNHTINMLLHYTTLWNADVQEWHKLCNEIIAYQSVAHRWLTDCGVVRNWQLYTAVDDVAKMKLNSSVIRDVSRHVESQFGPGGSVYKGLSKMVEAYRFHWWSCAGFMTAWFFSVLLVLVGWPHLSSCTAKCHQHILAWPFAFCCH